MPAMPGCVYVGTAPVALVRPVIVMTIWHLLDNGTFVEKVTEMMFAALGADWLWATRRVSKLATYT